MLAALLGFATVGDAAPAETLRAYLEEDASVARIAGRRYPHRNTVRYRPDQIERLTGRCLTSTAGRVQWWLAPHAVSL